MLNNKVCIMVTICPLVKIEMENKIKPFIALHVTLTLLLHHL